MTVEKGQDWGRPGALPPGAPVATTDAEVAAVVREARRAWTQVPTIGLAGGDLARTCGAVRDEERLRREDGHVLPVDVGEVLVDGELHVFTAHLVARRRWWRAPTIFAMNAQYRGRWDVAPRAHPNDGRLDLVRFDLPWSEWRRARARMPTGAHLPHPAIQVRRVKAVQLDLDEGTDVWLDGERLGPARALSIRCVPDAFTVVV